MSRKFTKQQMDWIAIKIEKGRVIARPVTKSLKRRANRNPDTILRR